MKLRPSIGLVVWAACAGALVGRAPRQIDWDLWWQRILGDAVLSGHGLPNRLGAETFTAPGAAWTPQEWLFSTLYALAHRAGADALFGFAVGAVAALALAVVARTVAVRGGGALAQCCALPAVTLAMFGGLAVRAQTVAWLPFALVVHALAKRKPWLAVPATVLWCNVHASGVLAPALVAVWCAGTTLDARRLDRTTLQRVARRARLRAGDAGDAARVQAAAVRDDARRRARSAPTSASGSARWPIRWCSSGSS